MKYVLIQKCKKKKLFGWCWGEGRAADTKYTASDGPLLRHCGGLERGKRQMSNGYLLAISSLNENECDSLGRARGQDCQ